MNTNDYENNKENIPPGSSLPLPTPLTQTGRDVQALLGVTISVPTPQELATMLEAPATELLPPLFVREQGEGTGILPPRMPEPQSHSQRVESERNERARNSEEPSRGI